MNIKLLAAAATGGVAVVGSGGYLIHSSLSGWTSVKEGMEKYGETYADNTVGKKFGKYFLSSKTNKSWWKSTRNSKFFSAASKKFKNTVKGYDDSESNSLNKVCESAYGKEISSSDLVDSVGDSEQEKFKISDIWNFCTPYPVSTYKVNSGFGDGTIAQDNMSFLVTWDGKYNGWFWDIRNQEFWAGDEGERSHKKIGADRNETNNVFKKAVNESKAGSKPKKHIKEICKEAYGKKTSEDTQHKNKDDALRFCSIKFNYS